jgi:predicted PolB exonuclease-like 3'-5' exonuclease
MRIVPAQHPERLLCVDIETIPDGTRLPAEWGSKFPKTIHHQVVAIAFVEAEIEVDGSGCERYEVTSCRSGGEVGWSEPQLLLWFWSYFSRRRTRVVTWNGRSFDIPVLLQRTMVHGETAHGWFATGSRYDGYGHRYSPAYHCDLMDVVADYGAAKKLSLDEAAAAVGLPGKLGGHGSEVESMMQAGEAEQVRSYCEADTLNPWFGLCVAEAATAWGAGSRGGWKDGPAQGPRSRPRSRSCSPGASPRNWCWGRPHPKGAHQAAAESLAVYLARERGSRPHLGRFLDGWKRGEMPGFNVLRNRTGSAAGRRTLEAEL